MISEFNLEFPVLKFWQFRYYSVRAMYMQIYYKNYEFISSPNIPNFSFIIQNQKYVLGLI